MAALYISYSEPLMRLSLNILVLQLKELLFLSVFLKHVSSFPKLAFCLCDDKKKSTVIIAIKMEEKV